jgi:hypothetical protein
VRKSFVTEPTQPTALPASTNPWLGWGTALLLGVIAFRCLVAISPNPTFDVDPLQNPLPWFGIGPSGVLLTSILMLLASSLILLGERLQGRGLDRTLLLLAVLPLISITWHGAQDATDLWHGADWLSAVVGGVALAHAVREPGLRSTVLGGLLGILAMLAIRGGMEVLVEHPAMVGYFEDNRDAVLHAFGWEPGSVQADLYERRLLQPEASGWFGLANLFSGLMVVGAILLFGSAMQKLSGGSFMMLLLLLLGMLLLILVNGSKGAGAAGLLGVLVLFAPTVFKPLRKYSLSLPGMLALGCLLLAIIAVQIRGTFDASFLGGERSLLFRDHYLSGAWNMITNHPLLGVGPAGFQEAYLLFKPVTSPEDPISAHSIIFDWLASLGVLGTAWIALLAMLALRCGLAARPDPDGTPPASLGAPGAGLLIPLALLIAGVFGASLEFPSLTPLSLVMRLVGILLAVAVAISAREAYLRLERWKHAWCMGGAMAALLALASIDMLFVHVGTVALAWAFVGTFAIARHRRPFSTDLFLVLVPVILALWVAIVALWPQWSVESHLRSAAQPLRALGAFPEQVLAPPRGLAPWSRAQAIASVRSTALEALAGLPEGDPLPTAFRNIDFETLAPGTNDPRLIVAALVRSLSPVARRQAIERIVLAIDADPGNLQTTWAVVEQLRLLAAESPPREARTALLEALVTLDRVLATRSSAMARITSSWVHLDSASVEENPDRARVVDAFLGAVDSSPFDPRLRVGLADAARGSGQPQLESEALESALQLDAARGLDPLVQFSTEEREELERRLQVLREQSIQ